MGFNIVNKSLNSIMNEMACNQSALKSLPQHQAKTLEPLNEIEAFILLDDTLENLHKQYLEAKAQTKELIALNGTDDAMAEIAIDMEDSAWCAMQTRYIELRAKRHLMARAQDMMRHRDKQIEELKESAEATNKQRQARDFMNYLKLMEAIKEKNKTPQIFEWLILFLIFRFDLMAQNANKKNYAHIFPIAV